VTFYLAHLSGTGAFLAVRGPVNITASTAPYLTEFFATGLAYNTWNVVNLATPLSYTGSDFFVGVLGLNGDRVGFGSGTVSAQGYHGMAIKRSPTAGPDMIAYTDLNALVRISGGNLPVELMTFSVE
jgi:hypothetical protein